MIPPYRFVGYQQVTPLIDRCLYRVYGRIPADGDLLDRLAAVATLGGVHPRHVLGKVLAIGYMKALAESIEKTGYSQGLYAGRTRRRTRR